MGLGAILRRLAGAPTGSPWREPVLTFPSRNKFPDHDFAVIDTETTGHFTRTHDRIVEIAVVRTNWRGDLLDEYSTLINPGRDVGPTWKHGISARDILSAPQFGEIAGDVADRISDAVVVGHNVAFDLRFLQSELLRLNADLPPLAHVCTMALSSRIRPRPESRRLSSCCAAIGISHKNQHSALGDARATAELLTAIIAQTRCRRLADLGCAGEVLPQGAFPALPRTGSVLTREIAASAWRESQDYLSRLVSKLPLESGLVRAAGEQQTAMLSYLDVLDRALEDRYLSPIEAERLMELAGEWGMDKELVREAHLEYLRELACAAIADGVVTAGEREDLLAVTRWLGLHESELDVGLESARKVGGTSKAVWNREAECLAGKSVCFTGETGCTIDGEYISPEMAEHFAASAGLIVKSSVSKQLDILVATDPLTLSTKGKKARQYGTRIIAERVFWEMIGVPID